MNKNEIMSKTKIVCTIGPASESKEMLTKLVKAGMNVMRLNFSHGTHEEHEEKINTLLEINKEKIKANYILGLESTSSRMFANAKCVLLQNKIKTQEDVINRINKIDKHDISYVLERCFKPGIISTAFVGQGVETDKLNSILENSKVAYKNSIDKKFLL